MRRVVQPGPPATERIQWVEARGGPFAFTMQAGLPLLEAARLGFAAAGFAGGTLNMEGGAVGPFAYVMPALSKTGENAAFYSDVFRPRGVTRLKSGVMHLTFIVTRCGPKPTGERAEAIFFRKRPWWQSPLASMPMA